MPTYVEGCDRLIYVVTSLERLATFDIRVLLTDRNAALQFATFVDFVNGIPEGFIDWELMGAQYWNNTNDRPDRMERRMAECLVSPGVPWDAVLGVSAKSEPVADEARAAIAAAGFHTPVNVRPGWYF